MFEPRLRVRVTVSPSGLLSDWRGLDQASSMDAYRSLLERDLLSYVSDNVRVELSEWDDAVEVFGAEDTYSVTETVAGLARSTYQASHWMVAA